MVGKTRAAAPSRRDSILDAAVGLYARGGDEGFTMDALAEKSGVSRITLYRHFASRGDVLSALAKERGVAGADAERPDVRARILEAAKRVFGTEGPHAATIERISELAGVGEATVYRHFGDKGGLLAALASESPARKAAAELRLSTGRDFEADLLRFATQTLTFLHENPGMVGMMLQQYREHPELFERVRGGQGRTHKMLTLHFAELMRQGRLRRAQPEEAAAAFIGLLIGYGVIATSVGLVRWEGPEHAARQVVGTFLEGLRAHAHGKKRGTG